MISMRTRRSNHGALSRFSTRWYSRAMTASRAVWNRVRTRRKPCRSSGPLRSPRENTKAPGSGSTSGSNPGSRTASRYLGASIAAIAVGTAPGNVVASPGGDSKERLDSLRDYLRKNYASQNLHNRVWMLWASSSLDGLLTPREKDQLIEQILAKQQASGGWSLGSLGDFARKGVTSQLTTPDGYATGSDPACSPACRPRRRRIPRSARASPGCGRIKIQPAPGVPCRSTRTAHPSRRTRAKPTSESSCGMRRQPTRSWH